MKSLERNIALYRWFCFAAGFYGWIAVFFLYFNQYVSLTQTIQLGAVYYFSVCICEVPSGYLSDRVGRRITLIISSIALVVAYALFLRASGFYLLATAQFFLAMGIAMMSGTDTAFLYDSLVELGRSDEYAKYEAESQKYGFAASALTALLGGALGLIDLHLAYWLSMAGAIWMLGLTLQFQEPQGCREFAAESMLKSILLCFAALKNRILAWLFAAMILMYVIEHITFEFYQPYIRLLDIDWFAGGRFRGVDIGTDSAALVSAVVIAVSMFGGTLGAAYSIQFFDRFGLKALLLMAFTFQLTILVGLSTVLSGVMLSLVMFRNFPMAMISAPVNATIAPRIGSNLRATYLSIQSLASRLTLSGLLWVLSRTIGLEQALDWPSLSFVLQEALVFCAICALIIVIAAPGRVNKKV